MGEEAKEARGEYLGGAIGLFRSDLDAPHNFPTFLTSSCPQPHPASHHTMSAQILPHQQSYLDLLLASQILAFNGPYTLKSGRKSPYFFNAGLFNTGAKVAKLAECYAEAIVRSGLLGSEEDKQNTVLFGPAYKVRIFGLRDDARVLPCLLLTSDLVRSAPSRTGNSSSHGSLTSTLSATTLHRSRLLIQPQGEEGPR